MKKYMAALAAGVTLVAGCKDSAVVNPTDLPTAQQLTGALTLPGLQTLVTGILVEDRSIFTGAGAAYPVITEIYARDAYRIDASEPRYVNETLGGNPDPGSFAGGGGPWSAAYRSLRQANVTLAAINNAPSGVLTPAQKSAALGFTRTFKALEYYRVAELRDTVGVALQADSANNTDPQPIICKENALDLVAALLDSANTDLVAAGDINFPFALPGGFTGFGRNYRSVKNFVLFNRGLKGKVDVYRGLDHAKPNQAAFTLAVNELTTALGAPAGKVPGSQFQFGPYYVFVPSGTEAAPYALADSKLGLNPAVLANIIDSTDTRRSKIVPRSTLAGQGLSTTSTFIGAVSTNPANLNGPVGILRDEEEVLLRAQAYIGLGQLSNAVLDINSVRQFYGLKPYTSFASTADAITAVLYEKRYSLLFEGPQRLVDLRAYGRLNANFLKKETVADPFNSAFPIPKAESDARGGDITPVCK